MAQHPWFQHDGSLASAKSLIEFLVEHTHYRRDRLEIWPLYDDFHMVVISHGDRTIRPNHSVLYDVRRKNLHIWGPDVTEETLTGALEWAKQERIRRKEEANGTTAQ